MKAENNFNGCPASSSMRGFSVGSNAASRRCRVRRNINNEKARAHMKKLKLLIIGLTAALPSMVWAAGGVEGSPHDFSTNSTYTVWNTRKGVCSPCHSAHNTDPAQIAPLWNHQTTTGPFTMYSSPTLLAHPAAQ